MSCPARIPCANEPAQAKLRPGGGGLGEGVGSLSSKKTCQQNKILTNDGPPGPETPPPAPAPTARPRLRLPARDWRARRADLTRRKGLRRGEPGSRGLGEGPAAARRPQVQSIDTTPRGEGAPSFSRAWRPGRSVSEPQPGLRPSSRSWRRLGVPAPRKETAGTGKRGRWAGESGGSGGRGPGADPRWRELVLRQEGLAYATLCRIIFLAYRSWCDSTTLHLCPQLIWWRELKMKASQAPWMGWVCVKGAGSQELPQVWLDSCMGRPVCELNFSMAVPLNFTPKHTWLSTHQHMASPVPQGGGSNPVVPQELIASGNSQEAYRMGLNQDACRMGLNQAPSKFQDKSSSHSNPPLTPSAPKLHMKGGVGIRGTQAIGLCSAFGEDPDPSNSGMDTNCSVIYWTRRALFDRASVTTVSFTDQHRTRVGRAAAVTKLGEGG
ncbi:uncharacterized protein LOC131384398 [Hylobates moloch]|uniref:uncharacterized protein LOC131384398 n=1 Tax=Hylobates moloch TaxID=81572 RepID=UPI002676B938|nr:uncharacterized protein LOC131384398 [Hylobates moloch]